MSWNSWFNEKGLGDMMSSWISTGKNLSISADQIKDILVGTGVMRGQQEEGSLFGKPLFIERRTEL